MITEAFEVFLRNWRIAGSAIPSCWSQFELGDSEEEAYQVWRCNIEAKFENEFCCEFPCISAMKLWLEIAGEGDGEEK